MIQSQIITLQLGENVKVCYTKYSLFAFFHKVLQNIYFLI